MINMLGLSPGCHGGWTRRQGRTGGASPSSARRRSEPRAAAYIGGIAVCSGIVRAGMTSGAASTRTPSTNRIVAVP
jgi:hypothetical protein